MKLKLSVKKSMLAIVTLCSVVPAVDAAIALDRTRIVFPGDQKSVSMTVRNQNPELPYLAQGWLENESGVKLDGQGAFTVLPPVQRVEANSQTQVKIQTMPAAAQLPQDRESLFYFNLREIPPQSDKPNVLQIALQTRIKMFYRPAILAQEAAQQQNTPYQEKLTLEKSGDGYVVSNPTPYFVTLIGASAKKGGEVAKGFEPLMVPPKGSAKLGVSAAALGSNPVLVYVNDYGGQPALTFRCAGNTCQVDPSKRAQ
ncbi:fimbria/pilus periplasmic chaperone [Aeromonas hydrophila]|uniref:fimbria/pilus periplasmic chaperone n=1 Tax=Aeromonas hydrophila TaxID=644 RepID=UPI000953A292|nr:fimbria/pilus periplasmic chaperone [Aeromonas hydrophila]SIR20515.1 P pilus assembly protein, chaperone PapD [Aeromonas hydrophila]SIR36849.1 P pilus assembly protein, chaperone PapD [Aeromonas hydrophila]